MERGDNKGQRKASLLLTALKCFNLCFAAMAYLILCLIAAVADLESRRITCTSSLSAVVSSSYCGEISNQNMISYQKINTLNKLSIKLRKLLVRAGHAGLLK